MPYTSKTIGDDLLRHGMNGIRHLFVRKQRVYDESHLLIYNNIKYYSCRDSIIGNVIYIRGVIILY